MGKGYVRWEVAMNKGRKEEGENRGAVPLFNCLKNGDGRRKRNLEIDAETPGFYRKE